MRKKRTVSSKITESLKEPPVKKDQSMRDREKIERITGRSASTVPGDKEEILSPLLKEQGASAMNLNMDPTAKDAVIMGRIAAQAMDTYKRLGIETHFDEIDLHMDLCAVHLNGCPLRLQDLLDASDFDFAHDVLGIHKNLNRHTGQLENFFLPRFAEKR